MLITKDSCDPSDLQIFIDECRKIGFRDHRDIKQLEIETTIEDKWGKFFYTYLDDRIISISGCHQFTHFDVNAITWTEGIRVCFRGAQLPGKDPFKGLSKYHMNSIPFREHLPLQMEWGKSLGYDNFFITTHNWYGNPANLYRGPSKEQNRTNKIMKHLNKLNVVIHQGESYVKGYLQNIWEINQDEYYRLKSLTKN